MILYTFVENKDAMDIKDIIKKRGYTIKKLCEKIGMDRSYFYKSIEKPTPKTLHRIAQAIQLTFEELQCLMEDRGQEKENNDKELVATIYKDGKGWRAFSLQELKEVLKEIEDISK